MWYLFYAFILLNLQHNNAALLETLKTPDILLTTVICAREEKSELYEKNHTCSSKEIRCSHLILDEHQEKNIIDDLSKIPECRISFLQQDKSTTLHIHFNPCLITINIEKSEDRGGKPLIICYIYDKKIIDVLELYTKKSILQYTFNKPFSLQKIYVKT